MEQHWIFSAPGRTEIGGNHTDHQQGCVLAAAVNLDTVGDVCLNGTDSIRIFSEGYPMVEVRVGDLSPRPEERNQTVALVRGIAAAFAEKGAKLKGFDAKVRSTVLPGSGLSSSAAFEVLVGTIMNHLFFQQKLSAVEIAMIGQYAENIYFGKPCGLMDQMASSVGGMVFIDFENQDAPRVEPIDFDLSQAGYALCIIDSGADHSGLTGEYGAIPAEMGQIASFFGQETLRKVDPEQFYCAVPQLCEKFSHRAVLRSMHFFAENRRVQRQAQALRKKDMETFLSLVNESGRSSWMYLQNIVPPGACEHQEMAIALALCDHLLQGQGAFRVHGGGFAGTIQAFVPMYMLKDFKANMEAMLGKDRCHVLSIRPEGGMRIS